MTRMPRAVLVLIAVLLPGRPMLAQEVTTAVGVWELAEINGSALPRLIPRGRVSCEVTAETLTLHEDGSYTSEATTACMMSSATDSEDGTWLQEGQVVTLTPGEGYLSMDGTILEPCANVGTVTPETIRIPTGCMSATSPVFRHSGGSSGVASVYRRSTTR